MGETWQFKDNTICFINGELLGGPEGLFKWASENYRHEDFRPAALYQTLTEEAYKNCLNQRNVRKNNRFKDILNRIMDYP